MNERESRDLMLVNKQARTGRKIACVCMPVCAQYVHV